MVGGKRINKVIIYLIITIILSSIISGVNAENEPFNNSPIEKIIPKKFTGVIIDSYNSTYLIMESREKLMVYNIETDDLKEFNINHMGDPDEYPKIWDKYIVYHSPELINNQWKYNQLNILNYETNKTIKLIKNSAEHIYYFDIFNNKIIYLEARNLSGVIEYSIIMYDFILSTEKVIYHGNETKFDAEIISFPKGKIMNEKYIILIGWSKELNGTYLYNYDLATNSLNLIHKSLLVSTEVHFPVFLINDYFYFGSFSDYYDLKKDEFNQMDTTRIIYNDVMRYGDHISAGNDELLYGLPISSKDYCSIGLFDFQPNEEHKIFIKLEKEDIKLKETQNRNYHVLGFPIIHENTVYFYLRDYIYQYNLSHDTDNDANPDYMDEDDDNDGYNDTIEISEGTIIWDSTSTPPDFDLDLIPDSIDTDDDNDGHPDDDDEYPYDSSRWKKDDDDKDKKIGFLPAFQGNLLIICLLLMTILWHKKFKRIY